MKIWRFYFSSFLFLLLGTSIHAQVDSTAPKYRYRLGVDLARAYTLPSGYGWMEVELERINQKTGILRLDVGSGKGSLQNDNLDFSTTGAFFRIGIAQNIVYRSGIKDMESASVGVAYGGSWVHNSKVNYTIDRPPFGQAQGNLDASNMYKQWIELNMNMRMKVTGPFYLGWTIRASYKISAPETTRVSPVFIPGFGRGDKQSAVVFNLYFSYLL